MANQSLLYSLIPFGIVFLIRILRSPLVQGLANSAGRKLPRWLAPAVPMVLGVLATVLSWLADPQSVNLAGAVADGGGFGLLAIGLWHAGKRVFPWLAVPKDLPPETLRSVFLVKQTDPSTNGPRIVSTSEDLTRPAEAPTITLDSWHLAAVPGIDPGTCADVECVCHSYTRPADWAEAPTTCADPENYTKPVPCEHDTCTCRSYVTTTATKDGRTVIVREDANGQGKLPFPPGFAGLILLVLLGLPQACGGQIRPADSADGPNVSEDVLPALRTLVSVTDQVLAATINEQPDGTDPKPWQDRADQLAEVAEVLADSEVLISEVCEILPVVRDIAGPANCTECRETAEGLIRALCPSGDE